MKSAVSREGEEIEGVGLESARERSSVTGSWERRERAEKNAPAKPLPTSH